MEPFREAIDAGVELVMVSTASYPTLGSKKQAAFSPTIVQGLLRDELGFEGVVITDDLQAPAVTSVTMPGPAAVNAVKAGDDLLLYAGNDQGSTGGHAGEVKSGRSIAPRSKRPRADHRVEGRRGWVSPISQATIEEGAPDADLLTCATRDALRKIGGIPRARRVDDHIRKGPVNALNEDQWATFPILTRFAVPAALYRSIHRQGHELRVGGSCQHVRLIFVPMALSSSST
jgi:hypothetical protein